VITEVGTDPRVVGLVYIAARAPDVGEDYGALASRFPTPPANAGLVYDHGFGGLTEDAFLNDFANGVDPVNTRTLYAVQGRISETLFTERVTVAAWRSKPCWYAKGGLPRRGYDLDCRRPPGAQATARRGQAEISPCSSKRMTQD
jgi:hypothetical protein